MDGGGVGSSAGLVLLGAVLGCKGVVVLGLAPRCGAAWDRGNDEELEVGLDWAWGLGLTVVVMGVVDIEVVVLVRGADVCLRRTSVTAKTELLASMGVVVELADVVAMVVVMVGAEVSIATCSATLKSSSSSAISCSIACCSMRTLRMVYSSSELSLESSMASST